MKKFLDTFKGSAVLSAGTIVSQLLSIAILPLTISNYSPSTFGSNGLLVLFATLFGSLFTLNSEVLVFTKKSKLYALKIVIGNVKRCTVIFITGALITLLAVYFDMMKYWMLVLPASALQAIYLNLFYINNKFGKYKSMAVMVLFSSISSSVLPNVFYQFGIYGLFLSYILGLLCSIFINWSILCFILKHRSLKTRLEQQGLYVFFQGSVDQLNMSLSATVITLFYGSDFFGLYSLAIRLLNAPLSFISSSLSQVYAKKISENRKSYIFNQFLYAVIPLSLISYIILNLIVYFGEGIIPSNWLAISDLILILSFGYFARFIASALSHTPIIYNRLKQNFKIALIGSALSIFVFFSSYFLGFSQYTMLVLLSSVYTLYFSGCVFWYKALVNEKRNC